VSGVVPPGALSIALALSIPVALTGGWIFGATYITVAFSVLVQGGSLNLIMTRRRTRHEAHV
jgi:monovalent cation:H+ antiporter, CPA1 family